MPLAVRVKATGAWLKLFESGATSEQLLAFAVAEGHAAEDVEVVDLDAAAWYAAIAVTYAAEIAANAAEDAAKVDKAKSGLDKFLKNTGMTAEEVRLLFQSQWVHSLSDQEIEAITKP